MKLSILLSSLAGLAAAIPATADPAPEPATAARGQRLRQREYVPKRQSRPAQLVPVGAQSSKPGIASQSEYSTNWGGVVQTGSGFYSVGATIEVPPHVSGGSGSSASAWVGIDGYSCANILQTGLNLHGDNSFDAWYEWYPDYARGFNANIDLHVGDKVNMEVLATSPTKGIAIISNLSTNQTVYHNFDTPQPALCQRNAEWIVEDYTVNGKQVPFADYYAVGFYDAYAWGDKATGHPGTEGAKVLDMVGGNGKVLSKCGLVGDDFAYCAYNG